MNRRAGLNAQHVSRLASGIVLLVAAIALTGCGPLAHGAQSTSSSGAPAVLIFDPDAERDVTSAPVDFTRRDVMTASQLESVLDRQLVENLVVTASIARSAIDETPDGDAFVVSLRSNMSELRSTMGLAYGPDAARAFDQLWGQHNQFFLDYAVARRAGDDRSLRVVMDNLRTFEADFVMFADSLTGGHAGAAGVAGLLATHVDQVTAFVDAYERGDFRQSVNHQNAALDHMYSLSSMFAGVIANHQPDAFFGTFPDATRTDERERRRLRVTEVVWLVESVLARRLHPAAYDALVTAGDRLRRPDSPLPTVDALLTTVFDDPLAGDAVAAALLTFGTALAEGDLPGAVVAAGGAFNLAATSG